MRSTPWPSTTERRGCFQLGLTLVCCLLVAATAWSVGQAKARPRPATPLEPVTAVLDAFRSHSVVALGEGAHGNEQGAAFRLALVRDHRFAEIVNDIVVECGNALYQDLMDRFIRGETVPESSLRLAWQNTTAPTAVCDKPIYEAFFRAVREVNGSLRPERQLRILLGDPPIDWAVVRGEEDHFRWIEMRDTYPAALIRREVLVKGRRALVVYGDMHLQRKNLASNYDMSAPVAQVLVSLLEADPATPVFTIWTVTGANLTTIQADVASWAKPSLALIRGTMLGAADFTFYYPTALPRLRIRNGKPDFAAPLAQTEWRLLRMEDQFNAVLYLGPVPTITFAALSPALCRDPTYLRMRLARIALVGGPESEATWLKEFCGAVDPR